MLENNESFGKSRFQLQQHSRFVFLAISISPSRNWITQPVAKYCVFGAEMMETTAIQWSQQNFHEGNVDFDGCAMRTMRCDRLERRVSTKALVISPACKPSYLIVAVLFAGYRKQIWRRCPAGRWRTIEVRLRLTVKQTVEP